MTTIEPRLIALLNSDAPLESPSSSLELPPLHDPNILKASGRPILLEPDTSKQSGKPQHGRRLSEEDVSQKKTDQERVAPVDRALGNSSPQSLRKILDHDTGSTTIHKKHTLIDNNKDDFVQLPQPPKKLKTAKQVVPPIINGLYEPPPQAALFPPIASSSFHDSHGRNSLNTVPLKSKEIEAVSSVEDVDVEQTIEGTKSKTHGSTKKSLKPRRRWTEEETQNLLLGVYKHGVGRWMDILADEAFSFNNRNAVDLKDRFRTCCPNELREKGSQPKKLAKILEAEKKSKTGLLFENILIDESDVAEKHHDRGKSGLRYSKPRAHRKNMDDLVQLGIKGPFQKSLRRGRNPFSEQDDQEILQGYQIYGPKWTMIQRDPRFHLQNRQATDLRDRFRNRYPDKFKSEEPKSDIGETGGPAASQSASILQTISNREGLRIHEMISENDNIPVIKNMPLVPQIINYSFPEPTDGLPSFDWNGSAPIGEMDISRFLEDTWNDNSITKEKQAYGDVANLNSGADLPHIPSFMSMLESINDDQINLSSDPPFN